MPIIKKITPQEKNTAYNLMATQQLVFVLKNSNDIEKMVSFVKNKNKKNYHKDEFIFIPSKYDADLIVAAVPELGPNELGVFAGREFKINEIIASYEGKDLWGVMPNDLLDKKITNCDESGDYFWHIMSKNGGMAIDSSTEGSVARFVNDSLQKNVTVEVQNDKVVYVAKRNIKFGEELTTFYGSKYFDESFPRVEYIPYNLQRIISKLFSQMSCDIQINNLSQLTIFLEAMGWDLKNKSEQKLTSIAVKLKSDPVKNSSQIVTKLPDQRGDNNDNNSYLYDKLPLIIDLSNPEYFKTGDWFNHWQPGGIKLLEKAINVELQQTSHYKLFAAPKNSHNGNRRFSLFAGKPIKKQETVCLITGEKITKKQADKLNANLIFEINKTTIIYCGKKASEALFVQGANDGAYANVKLDCSQKIARYIAIDDIQPGDEITAFYGENYEFASRPTTLEKVIYDFNQNQLEWDVWIKQDSNNFSVNILPHIMTPGRDLFLSDNEDDQLSETPINSKKQMDHSFTDNLTTKNSLDCYDYDDEETPVLTTQQNATIKMNNSFNTSVLTQKKQTQPIIHNKCPSANWTPNYFQTSHKHRLDQNGLAPMSDVSLATSQTKNKKSRLMF